MAYVVLKGEKKLAEVVGRAYGDLKAADAKRAEAALVRANPHLADLRQLGPGTMIVVPAVPGLRAADTDRTETPSREAVAEVSSALEEYRRRIGAAAESGQTAVKDLAALLKSKEVKTLLREQPDAARYVERATAAVKSRTAEHDARSAFAKTLTKAKADLDELAKKL